MKVQTNFSQLKKSSPDMSITKGRYTSFKSAVYVPRNYTKIRELSDVIYHNSSGKRKVLMDMFVKSGENLNNMVTALGTAFVAPIFIAFNPVSKEDKNTKAYTSLRQPISAGITLGTQLFVMSNYNKWLDKHAAFLGVEGMDLAAKPPVSVLKPKAKRDYEIYKAECIRDGKEVTPKKEWIAKKVTEYQDEAYYKQLNKLRETMDITKISMKDVVKTSDVENVLKANFKDILKDKYNFSDADLSLFEKYSDFKKNGKSLIQAKKLNISEVYDTLYAAAEDSAIKDLEDVIQMEAKVKHKSSKVLRDMRAELEEGKLAIWNKLTASKDGKVNHKTITDAEEKIQELSKKIYQNKLQELQKEYEVIMEKAENCRTEAEKITGYVYRKVSKAGSIENIKNHGETLEDAIRSVKIKKWLNNQINRAESKLKGWKDRSGIVVGLLILPITCGILNWSYPRIMEKFFPKLSAAKAASKAKMLGLEPPKEADNQEKEVK